VALAALTMKSSIFSDMTRGRSYVCHQISGPLFGHILRSFIPSPLKFVPIRPLDTPITNNHPTLLSITGRRC